MVGINITRIHAKAESFSPCLEVYVKITNTHTFPILLWGLSGNLYVSDAKGRNLFVCRAFSEDPFIALNPNNYRDIRFHAYFDEVRVERIEKVREGRDLLFKFHVMGVMVQGYQMTGQQTVLGPISEFYGWARSETYGDGYLTQTHIKTRATFAVTTTHALLSYIIKRYPKH